MQRLEVELNTARIELACARLSLQLKSRRMGNSILHCIGSLKAHEHALLRLEDDPEFCTAYWEF